MKRIILFIGFPLCLCLTCLQGFGQLYWGSTTATSWTSATGTRWSTVDGGTPPGTYNTTWVSGSAAVFNVINSTITGATTSFSSITANENVTVTASGTLGTSGTLASITVASGKTFDFGTQAISTTAGTGFIKNGAGILAITGGSYTGGFTLNNGTVIVRGVNAMGAGGSLTINGGIIAANNNRDLSGKYTGGITVGGDFTFGATTGLASSAANLTFSNNIALGSSVTRTITIGGTGIYTLGGVISGSSSGLTINNTAAGIILLTGANTYSGTTTVSGGTFQLNRTGGTTIPITNDVIVNGGTLRISSNQTINNLTLSSGTLTVDAGVTLTINGTFNYSGGTITNSGTYAYGASGALLYGTGGTYSAGIEWPSISSPLNVTIQNSATNVTLPGARSVAGNLIISSGATLTTGANDLTLGASASAELHATAELNISGGTTNFNNRSVILRSTASGTARIGQIVGTLNGASNVTVERFIPTAKRAWRLVSSPVSGTTINAAWQEGVSNNSNPNPGYGTHITGTGTGFDASSTNGSSLKTWNQVNQSWDNVTSTSVEITNHKGYIIFIRGDRSLNITGTQPAATTTTLRATGTLRQSDMASYVTTGAAATDYTIMGNPYASPIDLGLLNADHSSITTFYSWDPTLTGTNSVGGYVLIQKNGANWEYTPQGSSLQTNNSARFLPSGAAIFVKSPGSAVAITMKESYKVANNSNLTYFRTSNALTNLAINLNNSSSATLDGVRVKFDDSYSNLVTAEDANKLNNEGENIAIRRNGMSLIVEKRQWFNQDDTLFIRLSGMQQNTAYELKFFPNNFTGINAFVEDTYLNTITPLSLTGITTLNFSTDANVASVGDRFRLVFRPASVLPVTFTSIRAQEKNGNIQLLWDVTNEVNTVSYVVERSKDGRTFNTLGTVAATTFTVSEKQYQWLDVNASKGAYFYRIKSVQNSNESKYTAIVRITLGDVMGDINIYPNPVENGRLSVQLNDLAAGTYEIRILNTLGQLIINRKLQHEGGSSVEEIHLPAGTAKGIYRLQMLGSESRIIKTIVVE